VPIIFHGGSGGAKAMNQLRVINGSVTSATHTLTGPGSGNINLDGHVITYDGLAPILDSVSALKRTFTYAGPTVNGGYLQAANTSGFNNLVAPGAGESITFANPSSSLTVNLTSGDDIFELHALDAGWMAPTIKINSDGGGDEIRIAA